MSEEAEPTSESVDLISMAGKKENIEVEEIATELTLEERKEALKKSRWNVFMYLGIAAILFGFALFPMTHTMEIDDGRSSGTYPTGYVWGMPIDGEDYSDVPLEITVIVDSIPTDNDGIEIYVVEYSGDCQGDPEGIVADSHQKMRGGEVEFPNAYEEISDVAPGETYEIEFNLDPGIYCIDVFVDTKSTAATSDITVEVSIYPSQFIAGILATICLLFSVFAFIGAQKHGKKVKSMTEPAEEQTTEEKVLSQISSARIAAGPQGAPPAGPTGPPQSTSKPPSSTYNVVTGEMNEPATAGPSGPPTAGPAGPPEQASEPVAEPAPEPAPAPEAAPEAAPPAGDVYEDQGDGWFFRKFPDGTYDQTVYVVKDGQYVPHEEPSA